MRYDLTVPLSRFVAINGEQLPKPFKRYSLGPVWRAENTQRGRFREFYQSDVDIVGSKSSIADAEVIAAVVSAISDLGVSDLSIRINNRKIIDGVLALAKISQDKFLPVLRALDKIEKQGKSKVKEELKAAELNQKQVSTLFEFLDVTASASKELQDRFGSVVSENKKLSAGLGELSDVLDALSDLKVSGVTVDLKLARGLDYYTGTVCEISLSQAPEVGSIAGGGRYDNLISGLAGGENLPAVGMSIGIDRLFAALEDLHLVKYDFKQDVVIFNLGAEFLPRGLEIATKLRAAGIRADVYYGPDAIDKQFRYAEKRKAELAVIIGENEARENKVTIRELSLRKQESVAAEKALDYIIGYFN